MASSPSGHSPLIVAVEPDPLQARRVAEVLQRAFDADVVLADTAHEALQSLGQRIPELILTSALLPPKDEDLLTRWLRSRGDAAGHVQTVTIPVLEVPDGAPLFTGVTGGTTSRSIAAADACDPAMFTDWVSVYLDLASTGRRSVVTTHGDR